MESFLNIGDMKKIYIFLSLLLTTINFFAQQKEYFQQQVNYNISTELFPEENTVRAYETITYINNSPDTLTFIYFHLWANGYKNRHTALSKQMAKQGDDDLYFHAKKVGGYIDSLDFSSDGTKLFWEYDKKFIDICKVRLNKQLLPGDSVKISTPFVVHLPEDISRMGHKDSTYQITQWYPKPAVYDKYGWHAFPYLNQGEFYSEYGNFNVKITVPKQMVVGATGNLQNQDELNWMLELSQKDLKGSDLTNPATRKTKTLLYTEKNIHDFAWFCSDRYYVRHLDYKSMFSIDTVKNINLWALFTDKNKDDWKYATYDIGYAINNYSEWVGEYPYNNCTAVEGALSAGGGMEYPTITVISVNSGLRTVIVHEVGHNWFYGMLGFNEREYPFLDEGINTFYDHRYSYEVKKSSPYSNYIDDAKIHNLPKYSAVQMSYSVPAYFGIDQPLGLHSTDYSKMSYGIIVYEKTAETLLYLQEYLGRETFDSIMQAFFAEWKFKHPYPEDLQNFFEKSTDKNLDWFFDGFVKTNGKVDYKIKCRNNKLIIKNKGDFPAPINIVSYDKQGNPLDTTWYDNFEKKLKISIDKNQKKSFKIDPEFVTLDFNRYNNYAKNYGFFRKYEKVRLGLKLNTMNFYEGYTTILPFAWYNDISKFKFGAVITNIKIPPKKFTYYVMPMYSTGYKKLEGSAYFQWTKTPFNGFPGITYSFFYSRFAYFSANHNFVPTPFRNIRSKLTFDLQNPDGSDKFSKNLSLEFSMILREAYYYKSFVYDRLANFASIYTINFNMQKKSKLRPCSFQVNLDFIENSYKLWAEAKFHLHYFSLKDGLDIRFFTGSNVSLTSTYGINDFKYSHFYFSRYNQIIKNDSTFIPHQFVDEYGGITYFYPEQNYFFVNALNLKTTIIPKFGMLKLYYNFASGADLQLGLGLNALDFHVPLYEFGVMLDIIPHIFAVYLPVYGSQELMDYNNLINDKWYSHFRFTFKLENYKELFKSL